jgi:hypothetical protein
VVRSRQTEQTIHHGFRVLVYLLAFELGMMRRERGKGKGRSLGVWRLRLWCMGRVGYAVETRLGESTGDDVLCGLVGVVVLRTGFVKRAR